MTYAEIKSALGMVQSPLEKLEFVMDLGRSLEQVPESAKCYEIKGCASFVQICRDENRFFGMADSALVRGIVAIIVAMVDGKTSDEIKNMDLGGEFEGLNLNLGAGRLNGVNSMIRFLQNL